MKCKICESQSEKIFSKIILQKYPSNYYKCSNCSFVQTDEPVWISEAYESAITSLDIGLLGRNYNMIQPIKLLVNCLFPNAKTFLDYAGGYGAFTRIMRDAGFNYFNQDDYCENIFAKHFDIKDQNLEKFDVVTGFEVLEHFVNPLQDLEKVFKYSNNLIFSTEIIPNTNEEIENWWYITEETGQHVAFYSTKTMQIIAKKFNKNYYCYNKNLHIFTNENFNVNQIDFAFNNIRKRKLFFGLKKVRLNFDILRESLLVSDFNFIKNKLNKNK